MTVTERNDRKPPQRHLNLTTWPNRTGHRLGPVGTRRTADPGGSEPLGERDGGVLGARRQAGRSRCRKTRERGGRVPGFSTSVQEILVILAAFPGAQASRLRSRQAARAISTTAYPHRTANPAHGLSACAVPSGLPHRAPPALDGR